MQLRTALLLAWLNTTDDWQRMLVRCAGISFAVVLMFMETGFRNALFDSNVRIMAEKITPDIVIRSASRFMFSSRQLIPLADVYAARSVAGVRFAEPLYLDNTTAEIRCFNCPLRRVRVLAFDPSHPVFANFGLSKIAIRMDATGTAAADIKSKPFFGFPRSFDKLLSAKEFELAGQQLRLVGLFESGIDFSNDGNLVMTPRNFAKFFPLRADRDPLSQVDYAIVGCQPDAEIETVISRLNQVLGSGVIIETRESFLKSERKFWNSNTPIGLVFWVGTLIGFVVGMSICYQVLVTDITDHLSEFSTLKAMGYSPQFFAWVAISQAMLLSVISFVPGFLIALLAFQVTNMGTGLFLFLNWERTFFMLALTVVMCVFSGLIALRRLLLADPASLF